MGKHKKMLIIEAIFLIVIIVAAYVFYPRINLEVTGNRVNFKTINANVIVLSNNPDFSNSKFIDLEKTNSFDLNPGQYYWKASNGLINGLKKEFIIGSEVGMKIEREGEEPNLVNVGNVIVNVTKTKDGIFVGHVILEPDDSEEIEDEANITYKGGQA